MMFGQAIVSSSLDFLRISLYAYFVLSTNPSKSSYHRAIDALLLQMSIFLLYTNCSKSFYAYTLSSAYFRQIFRQSLDRYYRKLRVVLRLPPPQHPHPQVTRTAQAGTRSQHELQIISRRPTEQ